MVFSSLLFLGLFLPLLLALYYLGPKQVTYRNWILLIASLLFYAWGEPVRILLLLLGAFVGYLGGIWIERYRGTKWAKAGLIFALVVDIGLLVLFKYAGFFVSNVNALFGSSIDFAGFALPLGISFYTFQILSYVIDVYRGETVGQRSFSKLLLYVSLFPQLVAGPIVRYVDVETQIAERSVSRENFSCGAVRFTQGLVKKVIFANFAGNVVDSLIGADMGRLSAMGAWLGILMFAFQIYFDFSGYSDMAIGLGHFFGFTFLENFDYPYISKSVTEFWRRWHMSLGTFFRDYVYIPLGGNRRHQLFNIAVVWFLTGFWHGASWNFIFWGLYYGAFLIFEKKVIFRFADKIPSLFRHLYTLLVVLGGWVLFYFTDLASLKSFAIAALGRNLDGNNLLAFNALTSNLWLIIAMALFSTPLLRILLRRLREKMPRVHGVVLPVGTLIGLWACFILLISQSYNPFLYFRF